MVPMVYGMKCNLKLLEINFSKWKEGLGGNLDLMVSGSYNQISANFAAEIPVMEGYGLTETSLYPLMICEMGV
jgi:long-subunit acyl-CoA synthetase (AMP-forming)